MIRRRLSLQLTLVMLVVALAPLVGAGFLVLHLIEGSITTQVRASQEQLATAAGALVRDHLKTATTKLKSIATMLKKDEDPQAQTKRLNTLLDPPDLFLEIGYWTVGKKDVEVQAQAQQSEYNRTQAIVRPSNRAYNTRVGQQVQVLTNSSPILNEAANGNVFIAGTVDNVGPFNGLPVSVPAPGGAALTAVLDLQPVSQMLASVAGSPERLVLLRDCTGKTLAASAEGSILASSITSRHPVGHADWVIDVAEPRDLALAPLRQARDQALVWFGLAFVLEVGLAFLFAGRVVRPVRALARTADALGRGDFAARTGISREDEIGQLAQAFDRMAAAVQQIDQVKGEFVAHVSHELRTPLTSAKATVANVQEGIGGKESLGRVQEDLDRLIRMVNELLDVARIDAGIALAKQRTDLGALVRSTAETLRPIARVPLAVSGAGDTIDLDAARVQQIVLNLVDNALKYAKSRVDVEVRGREVRVTDDGPGVPPEHRERIFEKFSKVETGPKPPGAGLGLSIARKLAQLHGGSLACEGNTFVLRF
ncbi:MAG: HAMP domain-containing histidine kinase [Planctomycetes bacterium]|nr:HAMP domain-containing histidine kinase [Planctomycetota bacterium]